MVVSVVAGSHDTAAQGNANAGHNPLDKSAAFDASIGMLFNNVQESTLNHRRTAIALYKIQTLESPSNFEYEQLFLSTFFRHVLTILSVKKQETLVQKVLKFVCTFMSYSGEKDAKLNPEGNEDSRHQRFMESFIMFLLQGTEAKDKAVRFRVCLLIAHAMQHIGEMSDDLWSCFKSRMYPRLRDREANVRIQAINALSRIQAFEDDSLETSIMEIFIDTLQHDSSAEVRKAVLINIDVLQETLPFIIERARDLDVNVRRYWFKKKLEEIDWKCLSIEQRQFILLSGLLDRDELVQKYCFDALFQNWITSVDDNLIYLLSCLDIVSNPKLGEEILKGYFRSTPTCFKDFNETYWRNLTPETMLYLRMFCEYIKDRSEGEAQELLPELVDFVEYLQYYFSYYKSNTDEETSKISYEFILSQFLKCALILDVSDEVGRRYLFDEMRNMLMDPMIPDTLIESIVMILRKMSTDELDFSKTIMEMIFDISELIDSKSHRELTDQLEGMTLKDMSEDELHEASVLATVKCLNISKQLLVNARSSPNENPSLLGLFHDVILPAVESEIAIIQELGVECMGLTATLDKEIAKQVVPILQSFIRMGDGSLQLKALKSCFDVSCLYGIKSFPVAISPLEQVEVDLLETLKSSLYSDNDEAKTISVEGFSKLILLKIYRDVEVLQALLLLYYHPSMTGLLRIRQCLNFFLQVFAYSSHENQEMMRKIAVSTIKQLVILFRQNEKESSTNVNPLVVAQQFIDWTDSEKVVNLDCGYSHDVEAIQTVKQLNHPAMAIEMLKSCNDDPSSWAKLFISCLGKMKIGKETCKEDLEDLVKQSHHLQRYITDKASQTSLKKFYHMVKELYETCDDESDQESHKDIEDSNPESHSVDHETGNCDME